ncbi:family 78 glycoside hydrolase catalytic domain [Streptomyces sp. NPDC095613]|uniref:alpha-L-rhamnosidase n=1 Tax=Streptomyces sp. NPDC095613 TaxID=3155540 RepID=UPI003317D4FD
MSGPPAADVPDHRSVAPAEGEQGNPGDTATGASARSPRPYALRCDHRVTPLGIDERAPLLSWRLAADHRGDDPAAHRVRVAERPDGLTGDSALVWDTGRVSDPAAIGAVYAGSPLLPRTRYHWRVDVWPRTAEGEEPAPPAHATSWFETGLSPATDPPGSAEDSWRASWIGHRPGPATVMDAPTEGERALDDHGLAPCPVLRRSFTARTARTARTAPAAAEGSGGGEEPVVRARLYVTARGLYEVTLNGTRVGDAELAPGWTDYTHRVQYQTYDVTGLLRDGENVLAATLADGWWSGFVGFEPRRAGAHYGTSPQLLAELRLTGADGATTTVVTDDTWRTHTETIRHADLLMGECHDLRHTADGWRLPGFDDSHWTPALVTGTDHHLLEASVDEPVRATAEIRPRAITRVGDGVHIVDFGQNLAGRVRLRVRGLAHGARVVVRHAEVLDPAGRLYTANLRTAAATDTLIGDGRAEAVLAPRFTYHGFRYAEISGVPALSERDIVAVALHSDTPWAGSFDCSDPDIRRLHACVEWGQRSNFVSVPTDCPQRDERLGWLADAQVFLPTAALNADVAAFFTKWLRDVADARTPDGGFGNVAPRLVGVADEGAPGWGDAGVIIPWHLHRTYDDPRFLARALPGMRAWVDLIRRHNPGLVWRHRVGPHFSDWLAPGTPTPREVVATAYFAHSAHLTARAADVLGHTGTARAYHRLAAAVRTAFTQHFVTERFVTDDGRPGGGREVRVEGDTQTGYLLALAFGLLPEDRRDAAARRLAELVEAAGPALTTGFLGVALAAPVLDDHGRADLAHALLRRTDPPSWLFPLRHGATTIWERWDGWTPDTGFRAPSMNSFNHYALGSIGEWLYRGVAGLDQRPDSTGYRHLLIRPRPGDLAHASARYESVRGTVAVRWERHGDALTLRVRVPPGADAEVHVPTTDPRTVRESGLVPEDVPHLTPLAATPGHAAYRVASGVYRFTATYAPAPAPRPPAAPSRPPRTTSLRTSRTAAPSFVGSPEEDPP